MIHTCPCIWLLSFFTTWTILQIFPRNRWQITRLLVWILYREIKWVWCICCDLWQRGLTLAAYGGLWKEPFHVTPQDVVTYGIWWKVFVRIHHRMLPMLRSVGEQTVFIAEKNVNDKLMNLFVYDLLSRVWPPG